MLHMQNWRLGEYMWIYVSMVLWFWDVLSLLNPVPRTSGSPAESPRLRCCCDTRDHHLSVAWLIGGQLFQAHSAVLSVLKLCIRLTNWIDLMTSVSSSRKLTSNIRKRQRGRQGQHHSQRPSALGSWQATTEILLGSTRFRCLWSSSERLTSKVLTSWPPKKVT